MATNKTMTYYHINFTFDSNGIANNIKIESGFEDDKRTNLIYLGKGKMIDASSSSGCVKIRDFNINTTSTNYYPVLYGSLLDI